MAHEEIMPDGDDENTESASDKIYGTDPKSKSVAGFIEGLQILAKYMKQGLDTKFFCGGEHDVIYFYAEQDENYLSKLSKESEDGLRLSALGFHFDEDVENWSYFT